MIFETMSPASIIASETALQVESSLNAQPHPLTDLAISVRNVSKMYPLYAQPSDRLKQSLWYALPQFLRGKPRQFYREFWALRDISFEVKKGEALGIIGRNGSGKSTLLQIIAGTLTPTSGEVQVNGRVAALLELGSGFNFEFTGRENVYLNGAILGFSREEMDNLFDEIAAFADIGEFMDQPVKFYSSGMFVRLAFAVQACVEPDVLIVDEALSVGDIFFQQKCHARMEELLARQTAIIIVSHDMAAIEKYGTQTMLLEQGNSVFIGNPDVAIRQYYHLDERKRLLKIAESDFPKTIYTPTSNDKNPSEIEHNSIPDWPSKDAFLDLSQAIIIGAEDVARCLGIALCNAQGELCTTFEVGETAYFYYEFELLKDIKIPMGGVAITNAMNIMVHSKNSLNHKIQDPPITKKGSQIRFRQTIELALAPGEYTFGLGFGTISREDFACLFQMPYDPPGKNDVVILRVRQAGKFLIVRNNTPTLFHGYADLKGDCSLAILDPTYDKVQ